MSNPIAATSERPDAPGQATKRVRFQPIITTGSDLRVFTQAPPERESDRRYPFNPYPQRTEAEMSQYQFSAITHGHRGGAAYKHYLALFAVERVFTSFSTILENAENIDLEILEKALDTAIFHEISQLDPATHTKNRSLQIVEIFRDLLGEFLDRPVQEMQGSLDSFCQTLSATLIEKLNTVHNLTTLGYDVFALGEELNTAEDKYCTRETKQAFAKVLRWKNAQFQEIDKQLKKSNVLSQISAIIQSPQCQAAVRRFLEQEIREKTGAAAAAE